MSNLTNLGESIDLADRQIKLDGHIKNVLAYKPVLARIFKETISECKDMQLEEIESCIEGDVLIEVVGLNPGTSNISKIEGKSQEDFVKDEGKVTFDLRTVLRIPSIERGITVKLLVDVEAQKEDTPGYEISERAIFYCCRMISSQLSTEFTNSSADKVKYGNLKKVYSIWICTETSQIRANTIERYNIQRQVFPKKEEKFEPRYNLMEAIIVNISQNHDTEYSENELINFLTDLFNEELDSDKKISLLKNKYNLPTTTWFEREVADMTAYSAGLERKGIEKGIDKLSKLIQWLIEQGRNDDVKKVTAKDVNPAYREELFEEYKKATKNL